MVQKIQYIIDIEKMIIHKKKMVHMVHMLIVIFLLPVISIQFIRLEMTMPHLNMLSNMTV